MRPRTLDIVLTAAVFVTSVSESLVSAGVSGPRSPRSPTNTARRPGGGWTTSRGVGPKPVW